MTEHKHSGFLRAIADGDDLSQWECHHEDWSEGRWPLVNIWLPEVIRRPHSFEVRRKQRTIRIGDMDVPEPMRTEPELGTGCWLVASGGTSPPLYHWGDGGFMKRWLKHGMLQATEEGARLHLEALIRISGGTP
jgi:hypothetical protein